MPKNSPIPEVITIHDELGQAWRVDKQDDLWPDVLKATKNGTQDATLPISTIVSKRGWGWWSCFKKQDDWIRELGVPIPDHNILDQASDASLVQLGQELQRFGAYI